MKRLFPLLLLLILTLTYSDAMAIWTINGKLKLIEGNEFSRGNAYYSCPKPDPQKRMTGDGTSITLWGRDAFGDEFPWRTGGIIKLTNINTGENVDLDELEGDTIDFQSLLFSVLID